jgi:hypothetical protein
MLITYLELSKCNPIQPSPILTLTHAIVLRRYLARNFFLSGFLTNILHECWILTYLIHWFNLSPSLPLLPLWSVEHPWNTLFHFRQSLGLPGRVPAHRKAATYTNTNIHALSGNRTHALDCAATVIGNWFNHRNNVWGHIIMRFPTFFKCSLLDRNILLHNLFSHINPSLSSNNPRNHRPLLQWSLHCSCRICLFDPAKQPTCNDEIYFTPQTTITFRNIRVDSVICLHQVNGHAGNTYIWFARKKIHFTTSATHLTMT